LKSGWGSNFYNAVGGDYITTTGTDPVTLLLERNGSLLLLEGNSPTGTKIIWSFDSGKQDGNATSGWDSSENRYLIKLNGNEIWAAPPRSCPAPTAKFMDGWTNLFIQDSILWLRGYSNSNVWQSNKPSLCNTYPSVPTTQPPTTQPPTTQPPTTQPPTTAPTTAPSWYGYGNWFSGF
jgi:hypothetical protein